MLVEGDPGFLEHKEHYFMHIAKAISKGSTHPLAPGGCVIVRGREIIGDGRSLLATCKVEIDCLTYAIAAAAKNGTATGGAEVYTTRYPFSATIFQLHLMGIRKLTVLTHEWEPYYKDEFRRAARLARELSISIEPYFDDQDERFATNNQAPNFDKKTEQFNNQDLYTSNPVEADDYDIDKVANQTNDPNSPF
jgi:deoxycytidylate deaminase